MLGPRFSATSLGRPCSAGSLGPPCSAGSLGPPCSAASLGPRCSAASLGPRCSAASLGPPCSAASLGPRCSAASVAAVVVAIATSAVCQKMQQKYSVFSAYSVHEPFHHPTFLRSPPSPCTREQGSPPLAQSLKARPEAYTKHPAARVASTVSPPLRLFLARACIISLMENSQPPPPRRSS